MLHILELALDTFLSIASDMLVLAQILGIALCRFVGGMVCSNDYCGILGTCLDGLVAYLIGTCMVADCAETISLYVYVVVTQK